MTVRCVLLFAGALSLQNVSLVILPPAVQRGQQATLLCNYDLEGSPLYAVKWYRGIWEFYRFSPNDNPPTKIFPYQGIHVDVSMSNASQVVLQQVGFNLSGNISCEVTTDAPSFTTAMVSQELMVIELPKKDPLIHTEKDRYDVGDTLRANCSSAPSKPAASLSFFLNENPVGYPSTRFFNVGDGLMTSVLPLEVRVDPSHISPSGNLTLRCTALVATVFRKSVEVILGPRTSEPVPERVTSPSCDPRSSHIQICIILISGLALR
ncbi:heterophilic cell-cell adhesion [Nesidiocoris tenuis]|uniref:Heterophilic cell-cell adhesion n=1 Tax=Nesidiocoris tenuis TaxID=355587 RepID=A0ABN7AJQ9_9HEMI|nr:heterophilic cell-cell adhesion [Nesidiocoris tenuis]